MYDSYWNENMQLKNLKHKLQFRWDCNLTFCGTTVKSKIGCQPSHIPGLFILKVKLKSNGDKASPCLRPFFTGNMLKIRLPRLNYRFHLNTFLLNLTSFIGTTTSMKILYNFSHLNEFYTSLKSSNR
jgi:hypothetical protein